MRSVTLFFLFFLFLLSREAVAQDVGWDASLDRYERICNRCIDLRQRALAGEEVSSTEITDLLSQLSSLRNSLQESAGSMSSSQRERFEIIRKRYVAAFSSGGSPRREEALSKPSYVPFSLAHSTLPAKGLMTSSSSIQSFPFLSSSNQFKTDSNKKGDVSRTSILNPGIVAFVSLPILRPGVMARIDIGRGGAYVKGAIYSPSHKASYFCRSDGTTSQGFIWTTGKEAIKTFSVSTGATYSPISLLRLYAGGGYGEKTILWEDAAGLWARVSDLAVKGLVTEAGVLVNLGRISVMGGVSVLSFKSASLEIGAGFSF